MAESPIFDSVSIERPDRNTFDLSHQVLTTLSMGECVPTLCQEVVPGDKFRVRSEIFCRAMALKHPVMQKIDIYAHYFFVPNRLLWNANNQNDSWQAFITGGRDGNVECTPPYFRLLDLNPRFSIPNTLIDYLGYPVFDTLADSEYAFGESTTSIERMLAYPVLAYNLIWDNYYRDQNLQDPIFINEEVLSGGNILDLSYQSNIYGNLFNVKRRAWRKDYFTSCLPWAQRGEPVQLPIGTFAPVRYDGDSWNVPLGASSSVPQGNAFNVATTNREVGDTGYNQLQLSGSGSNAYDFYTILSKENLGAISSELKADLSEATSITVNDLRASIKLQEWLERNATGGARYVEQIYAHFGVVVPDATMQRPIYLGGGKQVFQISEVTQTTPTTDKPLGSYAGQAYSLGDHIGFDGYEFKEHGWIMCILSISPKASYMQGLNRKFSRFDKLDYYFPEFAHLGEQEVLNKEIMMVLNIENGTSDDATFGYQSRYAEYKYNEDRVCGDFRNSMIDWHLGRKFDSEWAPNLNDIIPIQDEETNRIFAYTADDEEHKPLMCQIYHDIQAIRPMPVFAEPYI